MDDIVAAAPAPRRRGVLYAGGLVGAGLVAGVVIAGLNVATAQTPTPTPSPGAATPDHRLGKHLRPLRGSFGKHDGLEGALHGEFTAKAPGGGYRTMAMQLGNVTAVSATSITVKSEDGFSRTYAVNDDTMVNAGDTGIGDVKNGDTVHVLAVVANGNASTIRIGDVTNLKAWREKWGPRRLKPGDASPSSAT